LSAFIRRVELKSGEVRYYPILNVQHVGGGYHLKKDAEARLKRAVEEDAAGMPVHDLLFREWSHKWLKQVKLRVKQSTWEDYESVSRIHLVPEFGHMYLKRIRVADVEDWKVDVADDMHPRTFNKVLTVLGTCLNDAVQGEYLNKNVAAKVDRRTEEKAEMAFLDENEAIRLLAFDCEIVPLIATALLGGFRQGELLALRWSDVDLASGIIRVSRSYRKGQFTKPKTKAARRAVEIPPELCEILKPLQADKGALCFPRDGHPWSPSTLLRKHFYPALESAGIRRIRWHDLRHSYAGLMISRINCPMKWLQHQMGHRTLGTTMDLYGHLLPESGFGSVQKLGTLLLP
jgi:integrase